MSSHEAFPKGRGAAREVRRRTTTKRGELLLYRAKPASLSTPAILDTREGIVVICFGGQNFIATQEMAECFLVKAQRILESHGAEQVPLLHDGGLEMLFIADNIPFSVGTTFVYQPKLVDHQCN